MVDASCWLIGIGLLGALAAVALLAVFPGWLGGKLAYRFGVRVADELAQTAGYR